MNDYISQTRYCVLSAFTSVVKIIGRSRRGRSDSHLRRLPETCAYLFRIANHSAISLLTYCHHFDGASQTRQRCFICGKPSPPRDHLQLRHLPGVRHRGLRDTGKQQGIPQRLGRRRRYCHTTLDRRVLARCMRQASDWRRSVTVWRGRSASILTRKSSCAIPSSWRTAAISMSSVFTLRRPDTEKAVRHPWAQRRRT